MTKPLVTYTPGLALKVCEHIADGMNLKEALALPGMPTRNTWYRWLMVYPELDKAYQAARELSAQAFEDDMLEITQKLKDPDQAVSDLMLKRYQTALQQLRWSAERRDPRHFGEKKETSVVVPVQINTSLDLGTLGGQSTSEYANVYELKALPKEATDDNPVGTPGPNLDGYTEARIESPLFDLPEPVKNDRLPKSRRLPKGPVPQPKEPKPLGRRKLGEQRKKNVAKRMKINGKQIGVRTSDDDDSSGSG